MIASKRLAVTESVWAELSVEREKKARLIAHLKQIADEGDYVELPP